jgi:1-acyl-sn-glycerol-3-phosphate acyltransferase
MTSKELRMAAAAPVQRAPKQNLWTLWFRSMGWTADYQEPDFAKYIVIVWPHTSNLDFYIGFIFSRAYGLPQPHFLAKKSYFVGPVGWLGRKVGGIPVDRSKSTNFVDQVVAEFNRRAKFVLAVTPEGTRGKTDYWKSGFYYMALAADVPVVMATIDFPKKHITYGAWFKPSGDLEADMDIIRTQYAGAKGRHPERQGEIRMRPPEARPPEINGQDKA